MHYTYKASTNTGTQGKFISYLPPGAAAEAGGHPRKAGNCRQTLTVLGMERSGAGAAEDTPSKAAAAGEEKGGRGPGDGYRAAHVETMSPQGRAEMEEQAGCGRERRWG